MTIKSDTIWLNKATPLDDTLRKGFMCSFPWGEHDKIIALEQEGHPNDS